FAAVEVAAKVLFACLATKLLTEIYCLDETRKGAGLALACRPVESTAHRSTAAPINPQHGYDGLSRAEPKVRIHLPPAASQERTSHRVTRRNVACQPRAATAWLRAQRASQPSGAPAHAPTRRSAPPRLASKVQWQLRDRLEPRRVVADGRVPAAWGVAADGGPRVRIHLPPAVSSVVEPRGDRRNPRGVPDRDDLGPRCFRR